MKPRGVNVEKNYMAPAAETDRGTPMRTFAPLRHQFVLFCVATQFLTRLPTPAFRDYQPHWLSQSARYFPAVGALVGAINVGVWWLARHWLPTPVAVGLMIATSLLVTGAFHEDGFADSCDGFGGGLTADRVLAIMKDSRIGAYGAIGITVMLGLKWMTLVAIPLVALPLIVVSAHVLSRWCSCGLIWALPYVRIDGDAKAKPLADTLSARAWIMSGVLGALAVAPFAIGSGVLAYSLWIRVLAAASVGAALTTVAAGAYVRQRIGGYTGDCLGAVQQLSELAFLLVALAVLVPVQSPA
jgi:adenosylcobinamide-GDP ribazoletransferase